MGFPGVGREAESGWARGGGLEQEEGTGKGDEKDKNQERDQYWRLYRMYSVRRKIVKIIQREFEEEVTI